jgi:hypothetical protein
MLSSVPGPAFEGWCGPPSTLSNSSPSFSCTDPKPCPFHTSEVLSELPRSTLTSSRVLHTYCCIPKPKPIVCIYTYILHIYSHAVQKFLYAGRSMPTFPLAKNAFDMHSTCTATCQQLVNGVSSMSAASKACHQRSGLLRSSRSPKMPSKAFFACNQPEHFDCACIFVCVLCVCMCVQYISIYMHVCMYVCMCVCMYVYLYVCTYICILTLILTDI